MISSRSKAQTVDFYKTNNFLLQWRKSGSATLKQRSASVDGSPWLSAVFSVTTDCLIRIRTLQDGVNGLICRRTEASNVTLWGELEAGSETNVWLSGGCLGSGISVTDGSVQVSTRGLHPLSKTLPFQHFLSIFCLIFMFCCQSGAGTRLPWPPVVHIRTFSMCSVRKQPSAQTERSNQSTMLFLFLKLSVFIKVCMWRCTHNLGTTPEVKQSVAQEKLGLLQRTLWPVVFSFLQIKPTLSHFWLQRASKTAFPSTKTPNGPLCCSICCSKNCFLFRHLTGGISCCLGSLRQTVLTPTCRPGRPERSRYVLSGRGQLQARRPAPDRENKQLLWLCGRNAGGRFSTCTQTCTQTDMHRLSGKRRACCGKSYSFWQACLFLLKWRFVDLSPD